jgi:hypothetical protein
MDLLPYLVAVAIGGVLGSQLSISQKNQAILHKNLLWVVVLAWLLLAKKIIFAVI